VAVLEDEVVRAVSPHETNQEYSSWLLPAVGAALGKAGFRMDEVGGFAVAAGPGSFTGVRVGLASVKAWAERYGKPVAGVSRLEALAAQASRPSHYVAAFLDAKRGQLFGAVYRHDGSALAKIGEEMVIAPAKFIETAVELAGEEKITWASPDPGLLRGEGAWREREKRGEFMEQVSATLAGILGRIGLQRLREGKTTDALGLDANYVRRSDAEIFWKGGATHGH
jgi:tRNA threonylcarbamoyladenosine biosynthesis protein TsaB